MGDTLSSTHRLHFLTGVLGQAIAGWTKAPRIGAVHFSNQMRTEVNSINTGLRKFESNGLSNKGPTDKAQSSLPFDRAARAHLTQQIGLRILPGQQSLGISSPTLPVKIHRGLLSQCLVRSLLIVVTHPASSSALLRGRVGGRWLRGFGFEHAMHLLVARVVARSAGRVNSTRMPKPNHHTVSRLNPNGPFPPNGAPLSTRMTRGKPCWRNNRTNTVRTEASLWLGRSQITST